MECVFLAIELIASELDKFLSRFHLVQRIYQIQHVELGHCPIKRGKINFKIGVLHDPILLAILFSTGGLVNRIRFFGSGKFH